MQTYRIDKPHGGYTLVYGEIHQGRFVISDNIKDRKEEVCVFSIVDLEDLEQRVLDTMTDHEARAQGFGVAWAENNADFLQTFGYRVASIREMEKLDVINEKNNQGFYFICYKSPLHSISRKFIPENTLEYRAELLGWRKHNSIYLPNACREAMVATYKLAIQFGEETAQRLGTRCVPNILDKNLIFQIENLEKLNGIADGLKLHLFPIKQSINPQNQLT